MAFYSRVPCNPLGFQESGKCQYLQAMIIKKTVISRVLIASALVAMVFLPLLSCASARSPEIPAVFLPGEWKGSTYATTSFGTLEGRYDQENTISWVGIPYAAPPVGDLRWQAPVPPSKWEGVRKAMRFGPKSVQRSILTGAAIGSEDSLYLNVWRPATRMTGLPVFVWIHGGGNTFGASNSSSEYFGHALASRSDFVYVSVNYRLDIFGWFAHPALHNGDPENDSGNFGTLDLIAALEWVRDNIEAFGGDPGNVTIAGESAGAFNVLTLLMAPGAKGLFHRAVAQSGYTRASNKGAGEFAQDVVRKLAISQRKAKNEEEAKVFLASMSPDETAKWLRKASPAELLRLTRASSSSSLNLPYPIFDGTVLPAEGFKALGNPRQSADVPLIIGTNKEETKLFLMFRGQNFRDPVYQKVAEATSAVWKAEGADELADAVSARAENENVYLYRFDWGAQDPNGGSVLGKGLGAWLGAAHGIEISFFLQTDEVYGNMLPLRIFTNANRKGRVDLQAKMGDYLANFVRCGNPNGMNYAAEDDQVYWKSWDASLALPSFIVFDADLGKASIRIEQGRTLKSDILKNFDADSSKLMKDKLQEVMLMLD